MSQVRTHAPSIVEAEPSECLAAGLSAMGVPAGPAVLERIDHYLDLLMHWNRVYGLIRSASREQIVTRHALDSAAALPFLPSGRKLDAGSGAGFPGLLLAALEPEAEWVLLDSSARKVAFLRHACAELGLRRVQVVRERLEHYQPAGPPGAVIARALAPLPRLVRWAERLMSRGSTLVAMLGRRPTEEQLAECAGVECVACEPVLVPGLDARRHVAVFKYCRASRGQVPANMEPGT